MKCPALGSDDQLITQLADSLLDLPYETWNFGESVAFEALLAASEALQDDRYVMFAHGWARGWAARATPYRRLDCTAPGLAMVKIAERAGDDHLLRALKDLADYLCSRPRIEGIFATWERAPLMDPYGPARLTGHGAALLSSPPAGVFVDCLHFDPPFLTALGVAIGTDDYWREGLRQAHAYVKLLQAESGLFDHFALEGEPGTFGPGWGRGQGWALLGLLDVVDQVGQCTLGAEDAAMLDDLTGALIRLIEAMVRLQREDGHWTAVVTDATSGIEASTAAFMGSAMYRAVTRGLTHDRPVVTAARRATEATRMSIARDGTLTDVSAAVMASTEPTHYAHVPRGFRVAWGQGPAVLALAAEGLASA